MSKKGGLWQGTKTSICPVVLPKIRKPVSYTKVINRGLVKQVSNDQARVYLPLGTYEDFPRSMWVQIVWEELLSRSSTSQCSLSKINLPAQVVRAGPSPSTLYKKDTSSHPESSYFALPGDPPKQGSWRCC